MSTDLVKHDFSKCIICQKIKTTQEKLVNPNNRTQKNVQSGYDVIESVLVNSKKEKLTPNLQVLAATVSLRTYLTENSAKYHKNCFSNLKKPTEEIASSSAPQANCEPQKKRQSSSQICCFLCEKPDEISNFRQVRNKNLNQNIEEAAKYLKRSDLLSKVSAGDLIAKDAIYHLRCLNKLYRDYDQKKKKMMTNQSTIRTRAIWFLPSYV